MVVRAQFPDMILPPDEEITKMFSTIWSAITIIGNIILRLITKGPIGNSNPDCK